MQPFLLAAGIFTVLLSGFLVAVHTTESKDTTAGLKKWYVLVNQIVI
jgi:hypothetical protein